MVELHAAAREVDLRAFEDADPGTVASVLSPRAAELTERGVAIADALLKEFERGSSSSSSSRNYGLAIDAVVSSSSSTKVADLAFMVVAELRQALARLRLHGPTGDAWEMMAECGSALRRLQKSLCALEHALCEERGLEPLLSYDFELALSLVVRRKYAQLWRFADAQQPRDEAGVRGALRGAGTRLAQLIGGDVYGKLRENDRKQVRLLQRRVLDWLRQEPPDVRTGNRLWEDFAGFCSMLRQINLRQELVEHDRAELEKLEQRLAAPVVSMDGAAAQLHGLIGLDDRLDALDPGSAPPAALREEIQRLLQRLRPAPPPSAASSESVF